MTARAGVSLVIAASAFLLSGCGQDSAPPLPAAPSTTAAGAALSADRIDEIVSAILADASASDDSVLRAETAAALAGDVATD